MAIQRLLPVFAALALAACASGERSSAGASADPNVQDPHDNYSAIRRAQCRGLTGNAYDTCLRSATAGSL